jgi:hypothetical protein
MMAMQLLILHLARHLVVHSPAVQILSMQHIIHPSANLCRQQPLSSTIHPDILIILLMLRVGPLQHNQATATILLQPTLRTLLAMEVGHTTAFPPHPPLMVMVGVEADLRKVLVLPHLTLLLVAYTTLPSAVQACLQAWSDTP